MDELENSIIVRLLRFLNFGAVADQLIAHIHNEEEVELNPVITDAAGIIVDGLQAIINSTGQLPTRMAQNTIFQQVATEKNLFNLAADALILNNHNTMLRPR